MTSGDALRQQFLSDSERQAIAKADRVMSEILHDQSRVVTIKTGTGQQVVAFRDGQEVMYGQQGGARHVAAAYTENDGTVTYEEHGAGSLRSELINHFVNGDRVETQDRSDYGAGHVPPKRYSRDGP